MAIHKLKSVKILGITADEYIGSSGSIFYDDTDGILRLSDGTTLGGAPVTDGIYRLGDDMIFIDLDKEAGIITIQNKFDSGMPIYIKGANCSDGGTGGDVVIEAGAAPLPNSGTTGDVEISAKEIRIISDTDANTWIFGADGNLQLPVGGGIVDSNGDSVLGGGGNANTGDIQFDGTYIFGPNDTMVDLNATDSDGNEISSVIVDPGNGVTLKALYHNSRTFGIEDWDTAVHEEIPGPGPRLNIQGSDSMNTFLDDLSGNSQDVRLNFNGGTQNVAYSGSRGPSGIFIPTPGVYVTDPQNPTTVTSIEFIYDDVAKIEVDPSNENINIKGGNIADVTVDTNQQFYVYSNSAYVNAQTYAIINTNNRNTAHEFIFRQDGDFQLPPGGTIRDYTNVDLLAGNSNLPVDGPGALVNDGSGNLSWVSFPSEQYFGTLDTVWIKGTTGYTVTAADASEDTFTVSGNHSSEFTTGTVWGAWVDTTSYDRSHMYAIWDVTYDSGADTTTIWLDDNLPAGSYVGGKVYPISQGSGVQAIAEGDNVTFTFNNNYKSLHVNAKTGNIGFLDNVMYSSSGAFINNSDLTHGATAAFQLPSNSNDPAPIQVNNLYGGVQLQTSNTGINDLISWEFGGDGVLSLPRDGTINNNIISTPDTGTIYTITADYNGSTPGATGTYLIIDNNADTQNITSGWIIKFANGLTKTITSAGSNVSPPGMGEWRMTWDGAVNLYDVDTWPLTVQSADYALASSSHSLEISPDGTTVWSFNDDKSFTLPNNGPIWTGSNLSLWADNQELTLNSNTGELTVPGDILATQDNDLNIKVFNSTSGGGAGFVVQNIQVDLDGRTTQFNVGSTSIVLATDFSGDRHEWTFDDIGILSLPYGNYVETSNINMTLGSQGNVRIMSDAAGIGNQYTWTFNSTGTLTFPDTTVQTSAYVPGPVLSVYYYDNNSPYKTDFDGADGIKIPYNTVVSDTDSGWDNTNKEYTCKRSGWYTVTASAGAVTNNGAYYIQLKSGAGVGTSLIQQLYAGPPKSVMNGSVVVYLTKDVIYQFRITVGGGLAGDVYSGQYTSYMMLAHLRD